MPDIGEGINEVVIKDWQVKVGDPVKEFDGLCEVESDKATATISSRFEGTVVKIHYEIGSLAKVGQPLVDIEVVVGREDEVSGEKTTSTASTKTETKTDGEKLDRLAEPIVATLPSVRQLAKHKGVDLSKVRPTGKYGQILKEDLLAYLEGNNTTNINNLISPPSSQIMSTDPLSNEKRSLVSSSNEQTGKVNSETVVPFTVIQKAMFKNMTKSLQIPHFNYSDEIDLTRLVEAAKLRKTRSESDVDKDKISNFAFIIKMVSLALTSYPQLNGMIDEHGQCLVQKNYHNIGIAVDTKAGLVVPNIKNVQNLSIEQINSELLRLRHLGYNSKLSPSDLSGGTISLSNIGAIGGIFGVPVIVWPEILIGAVGRIQKLPRFNSQGQVEARHLLQVVWSADHRVVDGATLSRFSNLLKLYLEEPETSLLKLT